MARKGKRERPERHKQSLTEQIEDPDTYGVRAQPRMKRQKSVEQQNSQTLDEKMTAKIMREAREQQEDVDAEENALLATERRDRRQAGTLLAEADVQSDSDDDEAGENAHSEMGSVWEEEIEISPEDEEAMSAFLKPRGAGSKQKTLADIILDKIKEKEDRAAAGPGTREDPSAAVEGGMDEKVVAVYKGVGQIMKRYSAGKIPKAFKIIPKLQNWEEVLYLTEPEGWSPHAVYQATRMFVSNLSARLAQRFLALVLLPHVREDIAQNKRLHFALFQAMKKATFKPDAFFKGLLLPLCRSGDCTLREAVIVSSVINRVSIPVVHSGAALLRLAEMPYAGTTSFFIRMLLDKKYALPYRVVDALVDHFLRFRDEERTLPVIWHQSLLIFVQRYKHEIRKEDQEQLRRLLRTQYHYRVSPEIHRELDAARSRGEKPQLDDAAKPRPVRGSKMAEDFKSLPPVVLMEED